MSAVSKVGRCLLSRQYVNTHGTHRAWGRSSAFAYDPPAVRSISSTKKSSGVAAMAAQSAEELDVPQFRFLGGQKIVEQQQLKCVRIRGRRGLPESRDPELPRFAAVAGPDFPAQYRPVELDEDWDLEDWAVAVRAAMDENLNNHGAMLFRGLPIQNHEDLTVFARYLKLPLVEPCDGEDSTFTRNMQGRSMQSKAVSNTVRTASDEPPGYTIEPHNEYHTAAFPKRLFLFCEQGPETGGEWITSDGRAILNGLRPEVVEKFERLGAKYIVFYESKADNNRYTNWQENIAPTKEAVEAYLTKKKYEWKWGEDDSLTYWAVYPSVVPHAQTGERCWFNQIHAHHKTFYTTHPHFEGNPVAEERWPVHCTYGDGSEIEPEVLSHLRKTVWDHSVTHSPVSGDLLVCDNYLSLHGRMSFPDDCERKVYVIAAYA
jgi:hypothetical protein